MNLTMLSKIPGLDVVFILISSGMEIPCMEITLWAKDTAFLFLLSHCFRQPLRSPQMQKYFLLIFLK